MRRRYRLLKSRVIQNSDREEFSPARNFASRTKGGGAPHLTELLPRTLLVNDGLCLPLAVLLGYFVAQPLDSISLAVVVMVAHV